MTPDRLRADGVEEGKRLIRMGGERGLSLAERISERFQRLTWRTPLHNMRLRGRHPLKLIAVADDPFFGDVETAAMRCSRAMCCFAARSARSPRSISCGPIGRRRFGEYLHSFAWLRDLSSVTTRATAAPIAEEMVARWLAVHGEKVSDPAWRADLVGRRILFWTAHAPLILSSQRPGLSLLGAPRAGRGARHLDRAADRVQPGQRASRPGAACWSRG
jgi:uncharacterized heparinase superfamily protein